MSKLKFKIMGYSPYIFDIVKINNNAWLSIEIKLNIKSNQ